MSREFRSERHTGLSLSAQMNTVQGGARVDTRRTMYSESGWALTAPPGSEPARSERSARARASLFRPYLLTVLLVVVAAAAWLVR